MLALAALIVGVAIGARADAAPGGALDSSFDGDVRAITELGTYSTAMDVVVQPIKELSPSEGATRRTG